MVKKCVRAAVGRVILGPGRFNAVGFVVKIAADVFVSDRQEMIIGELFVDGVGDTIHEGHELNKDGLVTGRNHYGSVQLVMGDVLW